MTVYEGLPRAVPEDVGMSTSRLETYCSGHATLG